MPKLESLKREFLELLDRDIEFRYAVAGYLGLSEILKRLDALAGEQTRLAEEQINLRREQTRLAEEQTKIWNEIRALREEQTKIWKEIERLREEQIRLREDMIAGFKRHDEEIAKLREDMIAGFRRHDEILEKHAHEIARLREDMIAGFRRHDEELARLREDMITGFKRHDEELARLREDFNKIYRQMDARLTRVERTLEKITVDIEDEARIVVKHRLREMGYEVEVSSLILPELEINLYGASNNICIIGEASVRASSNIIDEISQKIEQLRNLHPGKIKPKIIRVVYTSLPLPDLVERAKKEDVWVLKATGDIVKPGNLSPS